MRSEVPINKAKQVSFHEALRDPDTRAIYIRRECHTCVTLSLDTKPSRHSNVAMGHNRDGAGDHGVDEKDAIQHTLSCPGNSQRGSRKCFVYS